jgi:hypothetical protein
MQLSFLIMQKKSNHSFVMVVVYSIQASRLQMIRLSGANRSNQSVYPDFASEATLHVNN